MFFRFFLWIRKLNFWIERNEKAVGRNLVVFFVMQTLTPLLDDRTKIVYHNLFLLSK